MKSAQARFKQASRIRAIRRRRNGVEVNAGLACGTNGLFLFRRRNPLTVNRAERPAALNSPPNDEPPSSYGGLERTEVRKPTTSP